MATGFNIIGKSKHVEHLRELIAKFAADRKDILIVGEPGVGKRTFAACISSAEPVSVFNLLDRNESEWEGVLSSESSATVIFENLEESGFRVQEIILKFIGDRQKNTRIIIILAAATKDLLLQRKISENVCAKINGFEKVEIRPLRERPEDIPVLVKHFAGGLTIDINSLDTLVNLYWKENIRQLKSVVEHSIASASSGSFALPAELVDERTEVAKMVSGLMQGQKSLLDKSLDVMENTIIRRSLERFGFNESKAAQFLGLTKLTFDQKLRRLTLARSDPR